MEQKLSKYTIRFGNWKLKKKKTENFSKSIIFGYIYSDWRLTSMREEIVRKLGFHIKSLLSKFSLITTTELQV